MNKKLVMKFGWIISIAVWGFVAPNFCFTYDSIVLLDSKHQIIETDDSSDLFYELLEGAEHIQVKSRLFELWKGK